MNVKVTQERDKLESGAQWGHIHTHTRRKIRIAPPHRHADTRKITRSDKFLDDL